MPKKRKPPKKTRAPRGEGSVFPDKRRGGYVGKVPIGRYPNGRTKYTEVRAPSHAEVVALKKLVAPPAADITVSQWADRWAKESGAQAATKGDYATTIAKHIKPALGSKRVADLTAQDIEQAVRGWKLGANTARKNLGQIRTMLEAARRAELVTRNVAKDARGPKAKKVTIRPFSPAEMRTIVAAASQEVRLTVFALLASVGCRIGEALALDVADVSGARVSITKTYSFAFGVRRPKSENGIRTVTVPVPARAALTLALGGRKKGPLFPSRAGTRQLEGRVRDRWKALLKGLGIAYRSPHTLRHSVATHAIAAGTHVANVARDLGDSVTTIIKTYVHATDGPGVCEAMEGVLGAGK